MRIGVATGIVVVGDVIGQGAAQEQAVVGETPNLAARLQALAEPGGVVIAESTRRLLGGAFELSRPGRAGRSKASTRRFPAWRGPARDGEREPLRGVASAQRMTPLRRPRARSRAAARALARRERGRGPGRAGLGRSGHRQVAHSRGAGRARSATSRISVRYQCSPHHINDAFYPIVGQIWRAAGFAAAPRRGAARQAGGDDRAFGSNAKDVAPLLASLLSIPFEGRYPAARNGPARAEGAHDRGADRPVRGADARGAGPRAPGGRALDRPDVARCLRPAGRSAARSARVARRTFRPEFVAPWLGRAHVTSLSLGRFGRRKRWR